MTPNQMEETKFLENAFTTLDVAENDLKLLGNKIKSLSEQIKELRMVRDSFVLEKQKVEDKIKNLIIQLEQRMEKPSTAPKKVIVNGE